MKIPLLNIYTLTRKSLKKRQLETEQATRAKSNKLIADLLYENAVLTRIATEKRKGKK